MPGDKISLDISKKIRPPMYNGDEGLLTASQYKGGISKKLRMVLKLLRKHIHIGEHFIVVFSHCFNKNMQMIALAVIREFLNEFPSYLVCLKIHLIFDVKYCKARQTCPIKFRCIGSLSSFY